MLVSTKRNKRQNIRPGIPAVLPVWVKARVSPARYRHIQGVVVAARALARENGLSESKAQWAAWLHDCAKECGRSEMAGLLKGTPFRLDPLERRIPALWHPHAGAALARKVWRVRDRAILEAIRCHTLGGARMGPLAKVLFVADLIERNRRYPGVQRVRRRANRSLRDGVAAKCESALAYLLKNNLTIHPRLIETWNAAQK